MKLTKDTLIEGQIVRKGTEINIFSIKERTVDHKNKTVTMTKDEWKKTSNDYKGKYKGEDNVLVLDDKGVTTMYSVIIV